MFRRKKRNRKKVAVDLGVPSRLAAVLSVTAILALVYLWLCSRCEVLGQELKRLETVRLEVKQRVMNEEFKWLNAKSPQRMDLLLKKHNLEMTWPAERDIVRVQPETAAAVPALPGKPQQQYAHHQGSSMND